MQCANTEIDWEVKRGFEKPSVSRAVHLREYPLAERCLYLIQNQLLLRGIIKHLP